MSVAKKREKDLYLSMLNESHCKKYSDRKFAELTTKQNMMCRQPQINALYGYLEPLLSKFREERDIISNGGHVVIKYMMTHNERSIHYFVVYIDNFYCCNISLK